MRRRTFAILFFAATSAVAGAFGFACGFDGFGTGPPAPIPDTGVEIEVEANLPPRNDGSTDGPVDGAVPSCPTTGISGPTLVRVTFDGGTGTCIDETEVTNEQYAAFVRATGDGGDPSSVEGGVPDACAPFTGFNVLGGSPGAATSPMQGASWCQAYAYCKWAGKRLCKSEWRRVCSLDGTQSFPYGTTLDPTACNVGDAGGVTEAPVKSFPKCVGGFPGVFDMVGNVSEWIDECTGATCSSVGGGFFTTRPDAATCATTDSYQLKASFGGLGFRCCF